MEDENQMTLSAYDFGSHSPDGYRVGSGDDTGARIIARLRTLAQDMEDKKVQTISIEVSSRIDPGTYAKTVLTLTLVELQVESLQA